MQGYTHSQPKKLSSFWPATTNIASDQAEISLNSDLLKKSYKIKLLHVLVVLAKTTTASGNNMGYI